jgi:hypothetical protein
MDANVLQRKIDHKVRQRFGMTRDDENLFVRQRVRLIAEQFPTPLNRD